MEIDIRKAKEDERVTTIRWGDDEIINDMDSNSCCVSDCDSLTIEVHIGDIDNLILALKKYKELYGGNVS